MEIAIHSGSIDPYLEELPGGRYVLHADVDLDLANFLSENIELENSTKEKFLALWADPDLERSFTRVGDAVMISAKV